MCSLPAKVLFLLLLICLVSFRVSQARTERQLTGVEIPSRLFIGSAHIFSGSDTLYLNDSVLERGVDYRFVSGDGYFDLSGLTTTDGDTLRAIFDPLPRWVLRSYGHPLPEAGGLHGNGAVVSASTPVPVRKAFSSDIKLSGAKSFRFSARSTGASEFSQSLDLNISGEISDGVEISGSISDRGFDPAYGVANSRLNELDKISLKVTSRRISAQVGDIVIKDSPSHPYGKAVSGASFDLRYPYWHIDGAVARPRGVYATFEFTGRDGFQGPYQIGAGNNALPIVPGSETVWLDGKYLERGANKDYTVDYPTGRITFNVNHPIDRRSRIEVDYEPQATDYKEELFSVGGGGHAGDSALFFSMAVLREGDDKDQPLAGDLSDSDRALLEEAGDTVAQRSGVVPDTSGSYLLVTDSLPDTVFQFAGEGYGDYRVTFSFVGGGNGDYRFLGSGNYQYAGDANGDYLPIVILPAAQRTSYYRTELGVRNETVGEIRLDLRTSVHDRNLWSNRDDSDNDGLYYRIQSAKQWQRYGHANFLKLQRRVREAAYKTRERLDRADFRRRFLLPYGFAMSADETLHEASAAFSPAGFFTLSSSYATLQYDGAFDSRAGVFGVEMFPADGFRLEGRLQSISSNMTDSPNSGDGSVNTCMAEVSYQPFSRTEFSSYYERDVRKNEYFSEQQGTRYDRVRFRLRREGENIQYEHFVEDSLTSTWNEVLTRNRLWGGSSRRVGDLTYDMTVSYQWLDRPNADESNLLGRLNLRYNNLRTRTNIASSYMISEEQRNARGITYLEVEQGQGAYSLEDGRYIPDPDGCYIQVEEILSDTARVRRAEKSFHLSRDWRVLLVRFTSNIQEELLENGKRNAWWLLPFFSDEGQPYLFFSRYYNVDLRLWPVRGFHAISLLFTQDLEKRNIAGLIRQRRDTRGELSIRQCAGNTFLEESLEMFRADRDSYYSGTGEIDGYRIKLQIRRVIGSGEVTGGGGYRYAESAFNEISRQYTLRLGSRQRVLGSGELRLDTEFYRQDFRDLNSAPSYHLTGGRYGEQGAVWSVALNYGVKSGTRLNFSMSGRHSDDRTARVTTRGEMVAGF